MNCDPPKVAAKAAREDMLEFVRTREPKTAPSTKLARCHADAREARFSSPKAALEEAVPGDRRVWCDVEVKACNPS